MLYSVIIANVIVYASISNIIFLIFIFNKIIKSACISSSSNIYSISTSFRIIFRITLANYNFPTSTYASICISTAVTFHLTYTRAVRLENTEIHKKTQILNQTNYTNKFEIILRANRRPRGGARWLS